MARTFIFLGPPGCGKGTQASRLAENHRVLHYDMGSALRGEIAGGGELAKQIVRHLLERFFESHAEDDVILDGFPRSSDQVELIETMLPAMARSVDAVILFELDEDEIARRIIYRRYCPHCGLVYNLMTNPPRDDERCDRCREDLARRKDDTEEVLAERLRVYREQTQPVVEHFRGRDLLRPVDASDYAGALARQLQRMLGIND